MSLSIGRTLPLELAFIRGGVVMREVAELVEVDDSVRFRTEAGVLEGDDDVGDDGNLCVTWPAANFLRCG